MKKLLQNCTSSHPVLDTGSLAQDPASSTGCGAGRGGFSLIELSIVLVIVGIIMYGATSMFTITAEKARIDATNTTLDAIERALKLHYRTNGELPYAAAGADLLSAATFGFSSATTTTGVVPTRTLNLPDSYMFDGWGNRITYVVTGPCATDTNWTFAAPCVGALTVRDNNAPNLRTANAAYIIISRGKNGLGAFNRNGGPNNAATAPNELENNNANTIFRDDFIKDWDGIAADSYFDDMVRWKIPAQISYQD